MAGLKLISIQWIIMSNTRSTTQEALNMFATEDLHLAMTSTLLLTWCWGMIDGDMMLEVINVLESTQDSLVYSLTVFHSLVDSFLKILMEMNTPWKGNSILKHKSLEMQNKHVHMVV